MGSLPYIGKMAHLGVHGMGSSGPSDFADARAHGDLILSPTQIRELGVEKVVEMIPKSKSNQYFITFDIDAYDHMLAPGCGSPTFGAMFYEEMTALLKGIAGIGKIVGMDLVEVAPQYDTPSGMTAALAARTIADFLYYYTSIQEDKGLK
jgi:agmatinase